MTYSWGGCHPELVEGCDYRCRHYTCSMLQQAQYDATIVQFTSQYLSQLLQSSSLMITMKELN